MNRTCMRVTIIAGVVSLALMGVSPAQQGGAAPKGAEMDHSGMDHSMPAKPRAGDGKDAPSTIAYKKSMDVMMKAMEDAKYSGDPDADFMRQMRGHHQGAVDMAKIALAQGKDATVRKLARNVIVSQEREIAIIDKWLKDRDHKG